MSSLNTYRRSVERYTKEKAKLDKDIAKLNSDISKLTTEVTRIVRSISQSSSPNSIRSKQNRINRKQKQITDKQKKAAELEKKRSDKLNQLNRAIEKLSREQERADQKRHKEELAHAKKITNELRQQAMIQSKMQASPITIDLMTLPEEITVLLFAANPIDQDPLRLGNEVREIERKIRMSEFRDSVKLIAHFATRSDDLLQIFNEKDPHIIHFSGHGDSDSIVFEQPNGTTKAVNKDAIVQFIKTMAANVRVVLFNTCFSSNQAESVIEHVDVAIGMNDAVDDDAARVFAAQFYSAIGFGKSIGEAFQQAQTALAIENIPETHIPEIYYREDVNPFDIVLVRPMG